MSIEIDARHQLEDPALHDFTDVDIIHHQLHLGPELWPLTGRAPESAIKELFLKTSGTFNTYVDTCLTVLTE